MGEIILYLGSLSLGEFLLVWASIFTIVLFYLFLLYQLFRLNKDTDGLGVKLNEFISLRKDNQPIKGIRES